MSLKNRGLLKLRSCISSIVVVKDDQNDKFLRVFDEFLSSHGNKYKTDRILQKLYSMIDSTVILQKNRNSYDFHKRKVKLDETNYLKLVKKIGEGSYGQIHLCNLNNKQMVIKNPIFKKKNEKTEINNNFLRENLIHIVLHCCHELMNECFKISTVSRCIPKITDLAIATDKNEKEERLISVMEKLDSDSWKFFDSKHSYKEELTFIALVAYNLYFLQNSLKKFMHKYLHCGNIMIKNLKSKKKVDIKTRKLRFSVNVNYETYIIDFGQSCVDLGSCLKLLQMPKSRIITLGESYDTYHSNYCENQSHDLRLFLASVYFDYHSISENLRLFLDSIFSKYKRATHWHDFYGNVLKTKDKNFYPENLLQIINEELKK